jgi:hypothetical protein
MISNPSILGTKVLTSVKVWEQRRFFPPCINVMLDVLQEHHRLGHHARIALTLFLKVSKEEKKSKLVKGYQSFKNLLCNIIS